MANANQSKPSPAPTAAKPLYKQILGIDLPPAQTMNTHERLSETWWAGMARKTLDDPVALFTLILAVATTALWFVTARLWRATVRLSADAKATSADQADKMKQSIVQAARSAHAMEGVAESMAINAQKIVESVEITRAMARQQELLGKAQIRAYISTLIGAGIFQDERLRFEARPVMVNNGSTPASDLVYRIAADILPNPLPPEHKFFLGKPGKSTRISGNVLGPGRDGMMAVSVKDRVPDNEANSVKLGIGKSLYVWGVISYRDVFGKLHRCVFAQMMLWEVTGPPPKRGAAAPEIIKGWHLDRHNRSN